MKEPHYPKEMYFGIEQLATELKSTVRKVTILMNVKLPTIKKKQFRNIHRPRKGQIKLTSDIEKIATWVL